MWKRLQRQHPNQLFLHLNKDRADEVDKALSLDWVPLWAGPFYRRSDWWEL